MKIVPTCHAEDTSRARLQASPAGVQAFQQAAFGLSVHWGLYSLPTTGTEWIYCHPG